MEYHSEVLALGFMDESIGLAGVGSAGTAGLGSCRGG